MAEELKIVVTGDGTQFSRTISQVEAGIKRATNASQGFGHATVSSQQAASASLRLLEGGFTGNIRAAERFLTTIPGISTALKAAFPLVGAVAFGGMIVKIGEEVVQFAQKVNNLPKALQSGFDGLTLSAQTSNDELRLTNQHLADEISKMEHKPGSALKDGLDEARLSADHLVSSLTSSNKALTDLFKENGVGVGASLFSRVMGVFGGQSLQVTSPYENTITSYNDRLRSHAQAMQTALHDGNQGVADNEQSNITRIRQQAEKWATEHLAILQRDHAGDASYAPIQTELTGARSLWYDADDRQNEDKQKAADTERLKTLQNAATATEQARKAGEAQVKAWEQQLETIKSYADQSAYAESEYWALRAGSVAKGSFAYIEALEKSNEASARLHKEFADNQAKWEATAGKVSSDVGDDQSQALSKDSEPAFRESGSNAAKWIQVANEGFELTQKNAAALAEANTQYDLATNKITALQAAQITAMQHSNEYTVALDKLNDALKYYQSQVTSSSEAEMERRKNVSDTQNAISALNGGRDVQSLQDRQSLYGANQENTITGMLQKMVDDWGTMTQQIGHTLTSTIESFNGGLADALTAKTHNGYEYRLNIEHALGGTVHQAGASLVRTGLGDTEKALAPAVSQIPGVGGFLGGLLGKSNAKPVTISNSAANPVWVKSVDSLIAGATGGLNLTSLTGGGGGGDSAGLGLAPLAVPFLAGGGDALANKPVVVGDGGKPELFVPSTSGRVYPDANAIGGNTNHVYIDASNANDPAQTEAAVHRAMKQYLPYSVGASVASVQDRKARRPISKMS